MIRRYKRFFVDVELEDGTLVVAHCPNTGSLRGCLSEGARVGLLPAVNPKRKLRWTWVMIRLGAHWVGVHTGLSVPLVQEALRESGGAAGDPGLLTELHGYPRHTTEVKYGVEGRSRIDILLSRGGEELPGQKVPKARRRFDGDHRVYVEVKNTTLIEVENSTAAGAGPRRIAAFPDAVTERGRKHLHELISVVAQGHRAAMVYVVQRDDCEGFRPADQIDAAYGQALREAEAAGVELYAVKAKLDTSGIELKSRLEISLSPH